MFVFVTSSPLWFQPADLKMGEFKCLKFSLLLHNRAIVNLKRGEKNMYSVSLKDLKKSNDFNIT